MRRSTSGRGPGPCWRALWDLATAHQRAAVVFGTVACMVCAALAWLEPALLPGLLAVSVLVAALFARLRTGLLRRWEQERRIEDEAARGQRALERWLTFGELT